MRQGSLRNWLVLWVFLFLSIGGKSQEYTLQHRFFSIEDGLSSRFVRKVIQDQRGFIWIATSEGLNRYDGEKVLQYTKGQHGLPANDINLLFEGPDGLIWVGSWEVKDHDGVMGGNLKASFFDPITEKTLTFQEYFGDKAPFEEEDLFGLYMDGNRQAWLGTYSGKAYLYDGSRFELLVDNKGAHPISYALPAGEHTFWLLGPHALLRVDSAGKIWEQDALPGHPSLPFRISFLENGGLLIQSYWYLKVKYPGQELNQQYRLLNGETMDLSPYWKIQEDSRGWLWCFRKNNLEVFDGAGQRIADLSKDLKGSEEYTFEVPFGGIFVDADELAWGIFQKGLLLIDLRENIFRAYLNEQGFSLRSMIPLGQDEVLANTYKGMYALGLSSGKAEHLFQGLSLQGMGSIRAPDGNLWIALHGNRAARINLEDDSLELFPIKNQDGIGFDSYCPFVDKSGKLWMGTAGGIAVFDTASRQFVFDEYLNQHQYLGGKAVNWFCENEEGIWIGSNDGLFLLSSEGTQIQKADGLPSFYIFHIYQESSGRFWLSTRGGGLIRWDRAEKKIQQYNTKDGLSSNIIYAAYPDGNGFLWLPSQNGLMRFDTANQIVRIFKDIPGLPSNEFNNYAHLQLEDGDLLFGTINGMVRFSPGDILTRQRENTKLNILEVTQFSPGSGKMEDITGQIRRKGLLELTSRRRFIVLRFFLNDYFRPEENRYFYKIEGLDSDWQILTEPQVSIAQLPYGQYTLKVRAMGQDGYMAGNELAIPLHSIRPLYLRWWFFLVVAAAITGIVALLFRWRLWQLKRSKLLLEAEVARRTQQLEQKRRTIAAQKAHLEEMNAAKDKLFSIVGHELRGPLMYFSNIANRISYAVQKKEYDALEGLGEKAKNIAGSTNDMLNNLLNWSLLQGGRLSFGQGPADLQAVLEQVTETYQEVAALKKLSIEMETEPGIRVQAGADGLAILLQNLLSNAIKFSPEESTVSIHAYGNGQQAVIEVKDQGLGMSPQKIQQLFSGVIQPSMKGTAGELGAGLGLQIVREVVKLYNGVLRVDSEEGKGSTFTLLMPLAEGVD